MKVLNLDSYISNLEPLLQRVMKENLWSKEYTLRVIEEYKKFIFLATQENVAPSFPIDQVWHAHILFSKDYEKMCNLIGKYIHHQPTEKKSINGKTKDEYLETKKTYNKFFGEPPSDIWTNFKPSHYIYVDLNSHWIIPEGDIKVIFKVLINYLKSKTYGYF